MAYEAAQRVQSEERSVDTSDLEVKEADWHQDEADSTLLGYAELEVMGHKVCNCIIELNIYAILGGNLYVHLGHLGRIPCNCTAGL